MASKEFQSHKVGSMQKKRFIQSLFGLVFIFLGIALVSIWSVKPEWFLGELEFQRTIDFGDIDNDFIIEQTERIIGTNEYREDTDGDGLHDGAEVHTYQTNPFYKDTDADGYLDIQEVRSGSNPLDPRDIPPPGDEYDIDSDVDGLVDSQEYFYRTDKNDPDTDKDFLSDGEEINTTNTDPLNPDTDGDRIKDGAEIRRGTDPLNPDTDGDGVDDYEEIYIFETNPFIAPPKDEVGFVTKPLSLDEYPYQRGLAVPAAPYIDVAPHPYDFPLICEYREFAYEDSDGDRVPDRLEQFFATNPYNPDSDDDGYPDGHEIRNGFDPKSPLPQAYLFRDVTEEWQRRAVGELAYIVAVQGRVEQVLEIESQLRRDFDPDDYITRAEFLKIVLSLLDYICDPQFEPAPNTYTDMLDTDWFYDIILEATALNLIKGYPDRTVRPNEYVNRSEAAKIITLSYGIQRFGPIAYVNDFSDVSIYDWAYHFINFLHERDVIGGYTDNTYHPYQPLTRAEAFKMIGNGFNFANDELYRRLELFKTKIDRTK